MNSDDTESNLSSKIKRTVEVNEDDPLISKKLKISAESVLSLKNYETRTTGKSNDFKFDKDPCSSETLKNEIFICCSTPDTDTSSSLKFEENDTDKENMKPEIFQLSYADFLYIFEFLSTNDLVALSETCRYFRDLITNRSRSWKSIQTVCVVNDNSAHTRIYKYLNHSIEHFELRMEPPLYERMRYGIIQCFTANSFIRIMSALTNLKSIAIIYHSIGNPINISYFPKSITEIRFKGVYISVAEDFMFFNGIQNYLPNVQVIELDNIGWLSGNVFYSFAKLPVLKKLSITNCLLMTDLVPYACIACQQGFYVLETLDLRRCPVTDRDVICFKPLKTLKHVYLERPYGYYGSISNNFFVTFNQSEVITDTEIGIVLVDQIRKVNNVLETLVVRNYRQVTDEIINGCKLYIPNLKYLDVSGTSCTVEAVEAFKRERPGVTVKYENLHSDDEEQRQ